MVLYIFRCYTKYFFFFSSFNSFESWTAFELEIEFCERCNVYIYKRRKINAILLIVINLLYKCRCYVLIMIDTLRTRDGENKCLIRVQRIVTIIYSLLVINSLEKVLFMIGYIT
jgi:hypothetical protein